jgi:signal transduction histidine kinase
MGRSGLGLGLAISKRIIKRMVDEFGWTARSIQEAVFTFLMPLNPVEAPASTAQYSAATWHEILWTNYE